MWKRGKLPRSSNRTLRPLSASRVAVVEPPGPPPMTTQSYRSLMAIRRGSSGSRVDDNLQQLDARFFVAVDGSEPAIERLARIVAEELQHGAALGEPQEIPRLGQPVHLVLDQDRAQRLLLGQDLLLHRLGHEAEVEANDAVFNHFVAVERR